MGALDGVRVAVTGGMTGPLAGVPRRVVGQLIAGEGGRFVRSVSPGTGLLVASRADTNKASRARMLGVRVVSPGDLAVLLGYPVLF